MKRRVTIAFPPIQSNHNPYKCGLSHSNCGSSSFASAACCYSYCTNNNNNNTSAFNHSCEINNFNSHHHSHHHHHHPHQEQFSRSSSASSSCSSSASNISSQHHHHSHRRQQHHNHDDHHHPSDTDDWRIYLFIAVIAIGCYLNGIHGDFVHDDIPAITMNKDVLGATPITHVFRNDFWGTPMSDINSHKSYRPLTTLSFR
uniref:CSON013568 protein n=1 Tax=Culicoides sonorensis TaxID=179676 RepID=A0A336M937_CULSO